MLKTKTQGKLLKMLTSLYLAPDSIKAKEVLLLLLYYLKKSSKYFETACKRTYLCNYAI